MEVEVGQDKDLKELVGKDLSNFRIVEMFEVFQTDDDGRKLNSLGFFKTPLIAKVFSERASHQRMEAVLVLTNGTYGFVINQSAEVKLANEDEVKVNLKEELLAKLTSSQRQFLNLNI